VTELERAGLPTAHICTMTPVAEMVGSNRVVAGNGIVSPLGDQGRAEADERALRRAILERAIAVLAQPVAPRAE
jgi:glycine reductase